jgi:hypothetical protein
MKSKCCIDCEHHEVIDDKDPDDWFCDDDQAIVCTKVPNPTQNLESKWMSDHSPVRVVECSIRPYNLRKEGQAPDWCPLEKGGE